MDILKNKTIINELFEKGKYLSNGIVMIKFLESDSNGFLFAVSSKKFKRAVDRNRIKRLMKESARKISVNNKTIAFVYTGEGVPTFETINNSINNILSKI
jgi:ribonuclease P protein component